MPVKVRCSACEKVINAPDRARGKAVKCPQCGKPVRVPAEAAVPVAKAAKKPAAPPPSASMVIAKLDLDAMEDAEQRICPKCGSEVTAEDIECPECGVNLSTGMLSAQQQAERSRVGPDPKRYYKDFVGDSLEFWKKNKKVSMRLMMISLIFAAITMFCAMAALWCAKPLVRVFWLFMGTIALLIPPGSAWNLHTTIIDATLRKKKKLPKYHFDKLLGAALGLKLIFWFLVVALPLHILAAVFLVLRFPIVAAGLEAAALVFAVLLFPLASAHMAMPVTIRGWLINKMSGPFFRTFPALAYWAGFLLLLMIVPIGSVAGGLAFSGNGIAELIEGSNYNSTFFQKHAELDNLPKNSILPDELREWQGAKEQNLNWNPFWIPAGLFIFASGFFGATAVILMRANGLYARYFLNYIDLETMAPETVYVPKIAALDDESAPKLNWQSVTAGLGLAAVFGFAFGLGGASIMGKSISLGIGAGFGLVGALTALVGLGWLAGLAFKDNKGWFAAILGASLLGAVSYFVGPLGFYLSPLLGIAYGAINRTKVAKYPLVVTLVGMLAFAPIGIGILFATGNADILGFASSTPEGPAAPLH